jgi:predicted RNase H-like nuclease
MTGEIYVGVDSCRAGWFYTAITDGAGCETGIAPNIEWLWNKFKKTTLILIDIPIGLPHISSRACDIAARKFLGPGKGSSVFPPPCREALYAKNYQEACEINQKILGKKISKQAWGIAPKIRNVDKFLQSHSEAKKKIQETHPEVCFQALPGKPIINKKKSKEGFSERLTVLSEYFANAEEIANDALAGFYRKDVKRDDILDSMVAAVTARFGKNRLESLPKNPEIDNAGLPMEIVYPKVNSQTSKKINETDGIQELTDFLTDFRDIL